MGAVDALHEPKTIAHLASPSAVVVSKHGEPQQQQQPQGPRSLHLGGVEARLTQKLEDLLSDKPCDLRKETRPRDFGTQATTVGSTLVSGATPSWEKMSAGSEDSSSSGRARGDASGHSSSSRPKAAAARCAPVEQTTHQKATDDLLSMASLTDEACPSVATEEEDGPLSTATMLEYFRKPNRLGVLVAELEASPWAWARDDSPLRLADIQAPATPESIRRERASLCVPLATRQQRRRSSVSPPRGGRRPVTSSSPLRPIVEAEPPHTGEEEEDNYETDTIPTHTQTQETIRPDRTPELGPQQNIPSPPEVDNSRLDVAGPKKNHSTPNDDHDLVHDGRVLRNNRDKPVEEEDPTEDHHPLRHRVAAKMDSSLSTVSHLSAFQASTATGVVADGHGGGDTRKRKHPGGLDGSQWQLQSGDLSRSSTPRLLASTNQTADATTGAAQQPQHQWKTRSGSSSRGGQHHGPSPTSGREERGGGTRNGPRTNSVVAGGDDEDNASVLTYTHTEASSVLMSSSGRLYRGAAPGARRSTAMDAMSPVSPRQHRPPVSPQKWPRKRGSHGGEEDEPAGVCPLYAVGHSDRHRRRVGEARWTTTTLDPPPCRGRIDGADASSPRRRDSPENQADGREGLQDSITPTPYPCYFPNDEPPAAGTIDSSGAALSSSEEGESERHQRRTTTATGCAPPDAPPPASHAAAHTEQQQQVWKRGAATSASALLSAGVASWRRVYSERNNSPRPPDTGTTSGISSVTSTTPISSHDDGLPENEIGGTSGSRTNSSSSTTPPPQQQQPHSRWSVQRPAQPDSVAGRHGHYSFDTSRPPHPEEDGPSSSSSLSSAAAFTTARLENTRHRVDGRTIERQGGGFYCGSASSSGGEDGGTTARWGPAGVSPRSVLPQGQTPAPPKTKVMASSVPPDGGEGIISTTGQAGRSGGVTSPGSSSIVTTSDYHRLMRRNYDGFGQSSSCGEDNDEGPSGPTYLSRDESRLHGRRAWGAGGGLLKPVTTTTTRQQQRLRVEGGRMPSLLPPVPETTASGSSDTETVVIHPNRNTPRKENTCGPASSTLSTIGGDGSFPPSSSVDRRIGTEDDDEGFMTMTGEESLPLTTDDEGGPATTACTDHPDSSCVPSSACPLTSATSCTFLTSTPLTATLLDEAASPLSSALTTAPTVVVGGGSGGRRFQDTACTTLLGTSGVRQPGKKRPDFVQHPSPFDGARESAGFHQSASGHARSLADAPGTTTGLRPSFGASGVDNDDATPYPVTAPDDAPAMPLLAETKTVVRDARRDTKRSQLAPATRHGPKGDREPSHSSAVDHADRDADTAITMGRNSGPWYAEASVLESCSLQRSVRGSVGVSVSNHGFSRRHRRRTKKKKGVKHAIIQPSHTTSRDGPRSVSPRAGPGDQIDGRENEEDSEAEDCGSSDKKDNVNRRRRLRRGGSLRRLVTDNPAHDGKDGGNAEVHISATELGTIWRRAIYNLRVHGFSSAGLPALDFDVARAYELRSMCLPDQAKQKSERLEEQTKLDMLLANLDPVGMLRLLDRSLVDLDKYKAYCSQLHQFEGSHGNFLHQNDVLKTANAELKDKVASLQRLLSDRRTSQASRWSAEVDLHQAELNSAALTRKLQEQKQKFHVAVAQKRNLDTTVIELKAQVARLLERESRVRLKSKEALQRYLRTLRASQQHQRLALGSGAVDDPGVENDNNDDEALDIDYRKHFRRTAPGQSTFFVGMSRKRACMTASLQSQRMLPPQRPVSESNALPQRQRRLALALGGVPSRGDLASVIWDYEIQLDALVQDNAHLTKTVACQKKGLQPRTTERLSLGSRVSLADEVLGITDGAPNDGMQLNRNPTTTDGAPHPRDVQNRLDTCDKGGASSMAATTSTATGLMATTTMGTDTASLRASGDVDVVSGTAETNSGQQREQTSVMEALHSQLKRAVEERVRTELRYEAELGKLREQLRALQHESPEVGSRKGTDMATTWDTSAVGTVAPEGQTDQNAYKLCLAATEFKPEHVDDDAEHHQLTAIEKSITAALRPETADTAASSSHGAESTTAGPGTSTMTTQHLMVRDRWLFRAGLQRRLESLAPACALWLVDTCCRAFGLEDPEKLPNIVQRAVSAVMRVAEYQKCLKRLSELTGVKENEFTEMEKIVWSWRSIVLKSDQEALRTAVTSAIHALSDVLQDDDAAAPPDDETGADFITDTVLRDRLGLKLRAVLVKLYESTKARSELSPHFDGFLVQRIVKHFMGVFNVPKVEACETAIDRLHLKMKEHIRFYRGVMTALSLSAATPPSEILKLIALMYNRTQPQQHKSAAAGGPKEVKTTATVPSDLKHVLNVFRQIQIRLSLPEPPSGQTVSAYFDDAICGDEDEEEASSPLTFIKRPKKKQDPHSVSHGILSASSSSDSAVSSAPDETWKEWGKECLFTVDLLARMVERTKWQHRKNVKSK